MAIKKVKSRIKQPQRNLNNIYKKGIKKRIIDRSETDIRNVRSDSGYSIRPMRRPESGASRRLPSEPQVIRPFSARRATLCDVTRCNRRGVLQNRPDSWCVSRFQIVADCGGGSFSSFAWGCLTRVECC